MTIAPGTRVNENVRLVRLLGRGGMGSVWVARHEALDIDVAVKFIAPELLEGGAPVVLARFKREAQLAAKLDSPHVVRVLDHGLTNGAPYIVMELLRGETLSDRLARGRIGLGEAAGVVAQIAEGLEHAHQAGVVHRDIKPHNVFLIRTPDGKTVVKILDFGIAKGEERADSATANTGGGVLVGTPEYMSPEQLMRAGPADKRADIWALAVVAYEISAGKPPFRGETLAATLVAITRSEAAPVSQVVPDTPPALDAFFTRAFAVDPAKRYASARELSEGFALATKGHVQAAQPVTLASAKTASVEPAMSTAEFLTPGDPAARSSSGDLGFSATEPGGVSARKAVEVATQGSAGLATNEGGSQGSRGPHKKTSSLTRAAAAVAVVTLLVTGAFVAQTRVVTPPPIAATTEAPSAPTTPPSAPSAPASAAPRPTFANLPRTVVPQGYAPASSIWLPEFAIAREEGDEGARFAESQRACERRGMSLCTDAQWARACELHAEIAERASWTATPAEGGLVVRGGAEPSNGNEGYGFGGSSKCTTRTVAGADTHATDRIGLCCARAVGITAASEQVAFLRATSSKILAYETALNNGDGARVAELAEDPINWHGKKFDRVHLAEAVNWNGRKMTLINDQCRVALLAQAGIHGWSADCVGVRTSAKDVLSVARRFVFGDSGLLESATETRAPAVLWAAAPDGGR